MSNFNPREEQKKSGRYTKNNQASRREEVYKLHFEYGYSGLEIAKVMKINKNTIHADINHHFKQASRQISKKNLEQKIIKVMDGYELQKARLRHRLDRAHSEDQKNTIERIMLNVSSKSSILYEKMLRYASESQEKNYNISYGTVRDVVRFIAVHSISEPLVNMQDISLCLIRLQSCDVHQARATIDKMTDLGLEMVYYFDEFASRGKYDFAKFAEIHNFLKADEFERIKQLQIEYDAASLDEKTKKHIFNEIGGDIYTVNLSSDKLEDYLSMIDEYKEKEMAVEKKIHTLLKSVANAKHLRNYSIQ